MLTPQQLATLKTAIDADPVLAAKPLNSDGYFEIAQALNTELASPDFWVWKSLVSQDEIMQNGFDWVRVDNLSVGKARIWEWMFDNAGATINPSKANVRAGIAEVWKGTAADNAVRQAVFNHCQRLATRAQKLFATGPGTTTSVDGVGPATMAVEAITMADVEAARALP
jgi:hypothetical protein